MSVDPTPAALEEAKSICISVPGGPGYHGRMWEAIARALDAAREQGKREGRIAGLREAAKKAFSVRHKVISGEWMSIDIEARAAELEKEGR